VLRREEAMTRSAMWSWALLTALVAPGCLTRALSGEDERIDAIVGGGHEIVEPPSSAGVAMEVQVVPSTPGEVFSASEPKAKRSRKAVPVRSSKAGKGALVLRTK
jgi:hypothetical protein